MKLFNVLGYFYTQIGGGHIPESEKYLLRAKSELEKLINLPDTETQKVEFIYEEFQKFAAAEENQAALANFYPKLEAGGKISQETFKQYYLSELYVSILYSLGRTYFYDKETYKPRIAEFESYLNLANKLSQEIKQKTGTGILHLYLTEAEGLLFLKKEGDEALIREAMERYIKLAEDPEVYYEDGKLKKQPGTAYDKIRCYKQIISCSSLLKEPEAAQEYLNKLEYVLNQSGQKPERLAAIYNEIGKLFLESATDEENYLEAKGYFQKAYDEEKPKGKKDYPLFDACIGLAQVNLKSGQSQEAQDFFNEARGIAAVIYPNGHNKLTELQAMLEEPVGVSASSASASALDQPDTTTYYMKEQVYDNLLLQHPEVLISVYKYGGIKVLDQFLELGKDQDVAVQVLEEVKEQGVETVLSTLFAKQEESKNQEAVRENNSDPLLSMIDKIKEVIGENEASSLKGFAQYVMNALGHNSLTASAQLMIKTMSDSIKNLEDLLDASMYTEDDVVPYGTYITAAWMQLENLFEYVGSGQRFIGFVPRPPHFDPDDFGGGYGGYSGDNGNGNDKANDEEIEPYIKSILPIYSSNNTSTVFMGGNSTSLESDS